MMKKVKSGSKQQLHRGKEFVVESLKLPRDSVLGDSIITVTGNTEILIENYKGILQYSDELILLQGKNRKIDIQIILGRLFTLCDCK